MKTSHFALLFALVSFASAAYDDDDDVTDKTEESQNGVDINVCYDKEVCEIVVYSDMMCQLPSAAVRQDIFSYLKAKHLSFSYFELEN